MTTSCPVPSSWATSSLGCSVEGDGHVFEAELLAAQLHDNRLFLGDDVFADPHGAHGNPSNSSRRSSWARAHHAWDLVIGISAARVASGRPSPACRAESVSCSSRRV